MNNSTDLDYFRILPDNLGRTPMLMNDFQENSEGIDFLYIPEKAPNNHICYLRFSDRVSNPDLDTDYFDLDGFSVFSKKVKEAFEHILLIGFELIPAIIRDDNDEEINDFWVGNIYNEMNCFDRNKSKFGEVSTLTGEWENIEKLVIDSDKLKEIPLSERLFIFSKESSSFLLYHKSVIDIIQSVNPKGMRFVSIEEWHKGVFFDFVKS